MSKVIYDAGSTVLLKATGSAAVTATASTSVDLNIGMGGTFVVAVNVEAIKTSATDETYDFSVAGLDSAGSNAVTLTTLGGVSETGEYLIVIDADTAVKLAGSSVEKLQLTVTIDGTSPSITYSAWANPVVGSGRR